MEIIPVHRPLLPTADKIKPYLDKIDSARWYSNFGPLLMEFEQRLADHFLLEQGMLATAVNGTLMLVAALKAFDVREGSLCVMPSWTFVATASAACYAGLTPYFVDVDPDTQALDPVALAASLENFDQEVGAVIVVSPFGSPIDTLAWDRFYEQTGIPVIIDAAASFDSLVRTPSMQVGQMPIMVSMHATKVFGIGEGGFIVSKNKELVWRIKEMTSFGFKATREAFLIGSNAKLCEYNAAVGLASLDEWDETRSKWASARDHYIRCINELGLSLWLSPDWVTSTVNILVPNQSDEMAIILKSQGIDTRKWWLNGCHQHSAYRDFPKSEHLTVTEYLSRTVLGLPCALDISRASIERVTSTLADVINYANTDKIANFS